jgi:hypothetical protein
MGDTVWSKEAMPGNILMLDENVVPVWGRARRLPYANPDTTTVEQLIELLIAYGLMEGE